jgi:hypothetical protein
VRGSLVAFLIHHVAMVGMGIIFLLRSACLLHHVVVMRMRIIRACLSDARQ